MTDLTWLSTRELAARIADGEVSATGAVTAHLARIEEVNPAVNGVVTLDPGRALAEARHPDL